MVAEDVYDLSSCDLASGLDLIWKDGMLYLDRELVIPNGPYAITAISVLYLVVSLGQNIALMLGDEGAITRPWITEIVCFVISGLVIFMNDPLKVWVSSHDRVMACVLTMYIALYLVRHTYFLLTEGNAYTLNIITATLMLVVARLYCTFENPYCTIFLVILLTRLSHKLINPMGGPINKFMTTMDALVVSLHFRIGYRPSFWDPQSSSVYLCALCCACLAVGSLTAWIEKRAHPLPQGQQMSIPVAPSGLHQAGDLAAGGTNGRQAGHSLRLEGFHGKN